MMDADTESPLKYHNLKGNIGDYLSRYAKNNNISITCSSIGDGVFCIGTLCNRKIFVNEPVKDISIDSTGEVLAA